MKWIDDRDNLLVEWLLFPVAFCLFIATAIALTILGGLYFLIGQTSASFAPRNRWARRMGDTPESEIEYLPDEMGWRYWNWSPSRLTLCSPLYRSVWREREFVAVNWPKRRANPDERNHTGIHAARAPVDWWRRTNGELRKVGDKAGQSGISTNVQVGETLAYVDDEIIVQGLVERFGGFVRGTRGWRAEMVIIMEFLAPNNRIGLQLEQAFPDVPVRYLDPPVEEPPPEPPETW